MAQPLAPAGRAAAWLARPVAAPLGRIELDGKFFRDAATGRKWFAKGYAYGPVADRGRVRLDFARIAAGGANLVRVYDVPPPWLLDAAAAAGLRVMVDVPWPANPLASNSAADRRLLLKTVRSAARAVGRHPATFAVSVANEVPSEIVRFAGARATERLVDALIDAGRAEAPGRLFTFANYPRTEYLRPAGVDFACFNLYLHDERRLRDYLARLQGVAGELPLLVGEYGLDTHQETDETTQAMRLESNLAAMFDEGAAGAVVFRYTDEWQVAGHDVVDWKFGVVRRDRSPKAAFGSVARAFGDAPADPAPLPRASVVVCAFNGETTTRSCLESLARLNYPDYEVIFVDDGSTDATAEIAAEFDHVRLIRQPNGGLSHARNVGLRAASGEVVAYTDCDCDADEDWLLNLVKSLVQGGFVGVGGPNLIPDGNAVAACVGRSPGGPTHVMLDDRRAEHVPGCNMAFRRGAMLEVGGFDEQFRAAGDDVDFVWRLQDRGGAVGFAPTAQVWHHRRNTVRAYLAQQRGYGRAEALLQFKHPERFNALGGTQWRGRVYGPGGRGLRIGRDAIHHGMMGTGLFQTLYRRPGSLTPALGTSLEWHLLAAFLVVCSLVYPPLILAAAAMEGAAVALAAVAAWQQPPARVRRWWSGLLTTYLHWRQPITRGWARYTVRLRGKTAGGGAVEPAEPLPRDPADRRVLRYWLDADGPPRPDAARLKLLSRLADVSRAAGLPVRCDSGWQTWDLELFGSRYVKLHLLAAGEQSAGGDLVRLRVASRRTAFCKLLLVASIALAAGATARLGAWGAVGWVVPLGVYLISRLSSRRLSGRVFALSDRTAKAAGFAPVFAPGVARGESRSAPASDGTPPHAPGSDQALTSATGRSRAGAGEA